MTANEDCVFYDPLQKKVKLNAFFSKSLDVFKEKYGQYIHIQGLIKWHWQCDFLIYKPGLPRPNFSLIEMSLKNSTD